MKLLITALIFTGFFGAAFAQDADTAAAREATRKMQEDSWAKATKEKAESDRKAEEARKADADRKWSEGAAKASDKVNADYEKNKKK